MRRAFNRFTIKVEARTIGQKIISSDIRISYLFDTKLMENVILKISTYFDSKSTNFLFYYKTTSKSKYGMGIPKRKTSL
jgi:hypothetical protein